MNFFLFSNRCSGIRALALGRRSLLTFCLRRLADSGSRARGSPQRRLAQTRRMGQRRHSLRFSEICSNAPSFSCRLLADPPSHTQSRPTQTSAGIGAWPLPLDPRDLSDSLLRTARRPISRAQRRKASPALLRRFLSLFLSMDSQQRSSKSLGYGSQGNGSCIRSRTQRPESQGRQLCQRFVS